MSDEYRVINPPVNRVSGRKFREELQTAADDGFEWVGAVAVRGRRRLRRDEKAEVRLGSRHHDRPDGWWAYGLSPPPTHTQGSTGPAGG